MVSWNGATEMDYSKSAPYNSRKAMDFAYAKDFPTYNFKATNTRTIRAQLAKAMAGTATAKIGFAADSTEAGYTALASTQSPPIVFRDLFEKYGYPIGGSGPVVGNPGGGPGGFLDTRWSFTGAWTTQAGNNNFLYQTVVNGATATFASAKAGTIVKIRYMNNGGPFSYTIDGGASVPVTPSGGGSMATITVTGLANTTHTVVITTTSTSAFYLVWASVENTSGVLVGNFSVCSSTTTNWLDGNFYFPGNELVAWAPHLTFIDLGINDVGAGMNITTLKSNLQALITKFKATGDVVLVTSNPHESLDFTGVNNAKLDLAYENDIPLIDMFNVFESYAVSNPLGLYSDSAHPNAAGYAIKGRNLASAFL